jgi:hypothetical protein
MNAKRHSLCANRFDDTAAQVARYILRLALAILLASIILVSLLLGLSTSGHQTQAASFVALSYGTASSASGLCQTPTLHIAKFVDPLTPEVGSVVTISFVISGLNYRPIDVVLAQDVSGSMLTRLDATKAAAVAFVDKVQPADRVAVVAYSETARLVQSLTTSRFAVITAINGLATQDNWYTNVGTGIISGINELSNPLSYASGTVKAIILLSDGRANRPQPDDRAEEHACQQAVAAAKCGILVYTIGFGDANNDLLQNIANTTDGRYYTATDDARLIEIYQGIAMELRNIVITDVLQPGVDLNCGLLPSGWKCAEGSGGLITVVYTITNERPIADPLILSFTATVNLTPGYERQMINAPGSCAHYDGPGNPFTYLDISLCSSAPSHISSLSNYSPCQGFITTPTVCLRPYRADEYEPEDDEYWQAEVITLGGPPQLHNFSRGGDVDWVKADEETGAIYTFTTKAISAPADVGRRFLELYKMTSTELTLTYLASGTNSLVYSPLSQPCSIDSVGRSVTSPDQNRTPVVKPNEPTHYYLRVSSLDNRFGCGTRYELAAERSLLSGIRMVAAPPTRTVYQGQSAAYVLSVDAAPDFQWPVTLTVNTLPDIVSTLSPEVLWRGQSATLAATTGLTTLIGSHTLTVSGAGAGLSDTMVLTLSVLPADFSLGVTPSGCTMLQGEIASSFIELTSATPGFIFPVALSVGGIPTGTFSTFMPPEIVSGSQATLFITTTRATPLGSYGLAVTGTAGELERSTTATLRVLKARVFLPIIMKE